MVPTRYGSSPMVSSTRPQRASRTTSSTGASPWCTPTARMPVPIRVAISSHERRVEGRAPGQRYRVGGRAPRGEPGQALLVDQRRDAEPVGRDDRPAGPGQRRGALGRVDRVGAERPGELAEAVLDEVGEVVPVVQFASGAARLRGRAGSAPTHRPYSCATFSRSVIAAISASTRSSGLQRGVLPDRSIGRRLRGGSSRSSPLIPVRRKVSNVLAKVSREREHRFATWPGQGQADATTIGRAGDGATQIGCCACPATPPRTATASRATLVRGRLARRRLDLDGLEGAQRPGRRLERDSRADRGAAAEPPVQPPRVEARRSRRCWTCSATRSTARSPARCWRASS